MAAPDMEVIKDIPGYKVILKAVLKSQIQQLVEQLATHTEEDSIILTASIHDGTLSHLGTDSGKSFLDDHEDVKSQFLGFCLKYHHEKKQKKEREEKEEAMRKAAAATASLYAASQGFTPGRSARQLTPRFMGQHPTRPPAMRHHPYPMSRPIRAQAMPTLVRSPLSSPNKIDGQIIKIEPEDSGGENSYLDSSDVNADNADNAAGAQSPNQTPNLTPIKTKTESKDNDDDNQLSDSTIPNEQSADKDAGSDSNQSNLISGNDSESGEVDPNVSVKLEALTESEMELEITGVEPGRAMVSQDNWDPNVAMAMNFDPTGATGGPGDMSQAGYSPFFDSSNRNHQENSEASTDVPQEIGNVEGHQLSHSAGTSSAQHEMNNQSGGLRNSKYSCNVCGKTFTKSWGLTVHRRIHTGEKPHVCRICGRRFAQSNNLKCHMTVHIQIL